MPTDLDVARIRRILKRAEAGWLAPVPFGPNGFMFRHQHGERSIIVTCNPRADTTWVHASMTNDLRVPTYEEVKLLHRAVWGQDGFAYQVFVPASQHVNIHEFALHLWGRLDGAPVLPDFAGEFEQMFGMRSI